MNRIIKFSSILFLLCLTIQLNSQDIIMIATKNNKVVKEFADFEEANKFFTANQEFSGKIYLVSETDIQPFIVTTEAPAAEVFDETSNDTGDEMDDTIIDELDTAPTPLPPLAGLAAIAKRIIKDKEEAVAVIDLKNEFKASDLKDIINQLNHHKEKKDLISRSGNKTALSKRIYIEIKNRG